MVVPMSEPDGLRAVVDALARVAAPPPLRHRAGVPGRGGGQSATAPWRVVIIKAEEHQWHDDPSDQWGCIYVDRVVRDRIAERITEEERNWMPTTIPPHSA